MPLLPSLLLHTAWKWFNLLTPPHIFLQAGHCQGWWVAGTIAFLSGWWSLLWFFYCSLFCFGLFSVALLHQDLFFLLNSLTLRFWSSWDFTLPAHANTCALVTELVPSIEISSFMISTIMPSSFNPLMNCSFKHLSSLLLFAFCCHYS